MLSEEHEWVCDQHNEGDSIACLARRIGVQEVTLSSWIRLHARPNHVSARKIRAAMRSTTERPQLDEADQLWTLELRSLQRVVDILAQRDRGDAVLLTLKTIRRRLDALVELTAQ